MSGSTLVGGDSMKCVKCGCPKSPVGTKWPNYLHLSRYQSLMESNIDIQTKLSETNQTKLSLGGVFCVFWGFGARWQIGITNLPLSGNFVMGNYIRAIGLGFSDTSCPLTTLGLVDF